MLNTNVDHGVDSSGRHPCDWCGAPDRWPDRCVETTDDPGIRCASRIERECGRGDHRRCNAANCVAAERWHEPVRRAGVDAASLAGVAWAVVSTIENHDVSVVGIAGDLDRARSEVRDGFLTRAGIRLGSDRANRLYVVRGADGSLF